MAATIAATTTVRIQVGLPRLSGDGSSCETTSRYPVLGTVSICVSTPRASPKIFLSCEMARVRLSSPPNSRLQMDSMNSWRVYRTALRIDLELAQVENLICCLRIFQGHIPLNRTWAAALLRAIRFPSGKLHASFGISAAAANTFNITAHRGTEDRRGLNCRSRSLNHAAVTRLYPDRVCDSDRSGLLI
jgi:hypothetical protein